MYQSILEELKPYNALLIAVSKTKPLEAIQELYNKGQRDFGENRVQELVEKYEQLPKDIQWHQIGHLQKNKVKYIAPFVHLIHAVDSLELLQVINKNAAKNNRVISILLQLKIAQEETKFGLKEHSFFEILSLYNENAFKNISIKGVMGMASFTDDKEQVAHEFSALKMLFDKAKNILTYQNKEFETLSMGMSGDYKIALNQGSTMVRIGSLLFGNR